MGRQTCVHTVYIGGIAGGCDVNPITFGVPVLLSVLVTS